MATTKKRAPNLTIQGILTRYLGGMLSPAQQRAQARKDTNIAQQQSMRELRTTYQRERERTLREQYAQGAYAGLLRGSAAPGSADEQAIKNAYAQAAGLSQAEMEGFIRPTVAQQAQNTQGATTVAQQAAGYEGDVAAITPGAATGAQQAGVNSDVLMYLASLPKGTFAAEAEAAAKGANRANVSQAGEFALREAQLGQTLRELQDKYMMGVTDLKSGRAANLQQALGGYRESNRQDYATLLSGLGLMNTQQGNLLDYASDVASTKQSATDLKRKANAARGVDLKGNPLPGFYKAPNGRILAAGTYIAADGSIQKVPQGYKVGPKGKLVKAPYPSSTGAGGAGSKADKTRNDYVEKVRDKMVSAAKAAPLYGENPFTGIKGPLQGVTRMKARQYLLQTYGQQAISRYPGQKAAILQMIENILTNLGYKK